jgi:chlorite dismutase
MTDKCHNCGSLLVLVPPPENLDHDIAGRINQDMKVQMCSQCNIPHFEAKTIGKLFYYTNEERWRAHVNELEELHYVSFFTMKKGQKWYSWMPDKPENKTLYYSIFR